MLYHHIGEDRDSRYYVSPENFRLQIKTLKQWGYTAIPLSLLVEALVNGAELPAKPVVITFDDGHISVYENALSVMQRYGFVGVVYVVANRLESEDFLDVEQLTALINAGWEIGSHSWSHVDLTEDHELARDEILQSRMVLKDELGIDVQTFAYPFGIIDDYIPLKVKEYGYSAAVGLGKSWTHYWYDLYYLDRIEIHGGYSLTDIAARLPWSDP